MVDFAKMGFMNYVLMIKGDYKLCLIEVKCEMYAHILLLNWSRLPDIDI